MSTNEPLVGAEELESWERAVCRPANADSPEAARMRRLAATIRALRAELLSTKEDLSLQEAELNYLRACIPSTRVDATGHMRRTLQPESPRARIQRLLREGWPRRLPEVVVDASRLAVFAASVTPRWDRGRQSIELLVELEVPDRDTQQRTVVRSSAYVTEEAFHPALLDGQLPHLVRDVAAHALVDALTHEVEETLRVDGAPWEDPHARLLRAKEAP